MTWVFDPTDPNLAQTLQSLPRVEGYCIFADMVNSTALKDAGLVRWAPAIYNTFTNVRSWLQPGTTPLKGLGDALMFYITEAQLSQSGYSVLQLFSSLASAARDPDPIFAELRIGVCHCLDVYEMSFLPNVPDVYGKDIDLTARVVSIAGPREVAMNERFYDRVRQSYQATGNQEQFAEVVEIVGPWPQQFKGFPRPMTIYKLPTP